MSIHELKANFISAADTLIIRSRVATDPANPASDRFFTWEIEQKARTWGEVQKLLDGLNDDRETIAAVWRVEPDSNGIPRIEDVTEFFDVRTVDEIEEDVRHVEAVAERRYSAASHAQTGVQRSYGVRL